MADADDDTDAPDTDAVPPESFDERMSAGMAEIFDKIEQRESEADAAPADAERARAADGKFQSTKDRAAPAAAAPSKITDQAQPAAPGTAPPSTDAPHSWSAEARALWGALPPDAQRYIAQREGDAHKQITQTGERLKGYEAFEQALAPYRAQLVSTWGSEARGVEALLNIAAAANADWPAFVREQSRLRGFDLSQLIPAAQYQPADPQTAALTSEVSNLKRALSDIVNAQTAAQEQAIADEIAAFTTPDHPHFDACKPLMASLIRSGAAKGLADAYEQAVYANPATRASVLAEQEARRKADAEQEAKKLAAEAARHRAINVTAKGRGASPAPKRSWDETMGEAYDRVSAA